MEDVYRTSALWILPFNAAHASFVLRHQHDGVGGWLSQPAWEAGSEVAGRTSDDFPASLLVLRWQHPAQHGSLPVSRRRNAVVKFVWSCCVGGIVVLVRRRWTIALNARGERGPRLG